MQIITGALLLLGILVSGRAGSLAQRASGGPHGCAGGHTPSFGPGSPEQGGPGAHRPRVEDAVRHTFKAGEGGKLTLDAAVGDVEVSASEGRAVTVEIVRRVEADDRGEAARLLENLLVEKEQQGADVVVRVRFRRETPDDERRRVGLRFQINVPPSYSLDVETVGSLRAGDLRGGVRVETSGGDISLGRVGGEVNAVSSGGSVRIEGAGGTSRVSTGGGAVSILEAAAVEAETGGGSFRATLSRQPQADSHVSTSGGKIELGIGPGVGVELDAQAADGRVSSEEDEAGGRRAKRNSLRAAVNGGGPLLVLRSAGGSIRLGKGSAGAVGR